jgi:hypothetical protein
MRICRRQYEFMNNCRSTLTEKDRPAVEEMLEESETHKGSTANLYNRTFEYKPLLSMHTCFVVLISPEDPSFRASCWYSHLLLQLHVGATVPQRVR